MYVYILCLEKVIFFFHFWLQAHHSQLHSSNMTEFADFVSLDIVNVFICRNLITLSSFE